VLPVAVNGSHRAAEATSRERLAFPTTFPAKVGTLPVVWQSEASKDVLVAYVQTYLSHEIQAEALVRNLSTQSTSRDCASLSIIPAW
jgi:hypothetical protein